MAITHYILQPPTLLLIRPPISLSPSARTPGWWLQRWGGRVIHERGGRNVYEHHMSFQLHALHARTRAHAWRQVQSCRRVHGTEGGPCYRWHRALSCALLYHWRLCGHRLIYGLLYRNRHAITFSHCTVTVQEQAQTNSVFSERQKKVLTPICHQIQKNSTY